MSVDDREESMVVSESTERADYDFKTRPQETVEATSRTFLVYCLNMEQKTNVTHVFKASFCSLFIYDLINH
jgi:hypothetical protein